MELNEQIYELSNQQLETQIRRRVQEINKIKRILVENRNDLNDFRDAREVFEKEIDDLLQFINEKLMTVDNRRDRAIYLKQLKFFDKVLKFVEKEAKNLIQRISHYEAMEVAKGNIKMWGEDENIDEIPEQEEAVQLGGRNPYALLEGHEGKFTAQFKARKPHLRHLKSLKEFAHYILTHPTEFNKISKQRANYYRNLIQKGSGNLFLKKYNV